MHMYMEEKKWKKSQEQSLELKPYRVKKSKLKSTNSWLVSMLNQQRENRRYYSINF